MKLFKGGGRGKKMGTEALVLGAPGLPCLVALLRGPASKWNLSVGCVGTCNTWCPLLPNSGCSFHGIMKFCANITGEEFLELFIHISGTLSKLVRVCVLHVFQDKPVL